MKNYIIHISNIPLLLDDDDIEKLLGKCVDFVKWKRFYGINGNRFPFGFAEFSSMNGMISCYNLFNDVEIDNKKISISSEHDIYQIEKTEEIQAVKKMIKSINDKIIKNKRAQEFIDEYNLKTYGKSSIYMEEDSELLRTLWIEEERKRANIDIEEEIKKLEVHDENTDLFYVDRQAWRIKRRNAKDEYIKKIKNLS
ncbi:RNA-binding protein 25 [Astathelohania contejeani]|uniref:RNA-binding protein 25 n=1 Tax=Astathelohania contejeani TaxID=164912 RepID=A0ABQ7HWG0_9MICR|nr:RNA-binding protein 25 [Thelohania contejeani]